MFWSKNTQNLFFVEKNYFFVRNNFFFPQIFFGFFLKFFRVENTCFHTLTPYPTHPYPNHLPYKPTPNMRIYTQTYINTIIGAFLCVCVSVCVCVCVCNIRVNLFSTIYFSTCSFLSLYPIFDDGDDTLTLD